MEKNDRKLGRRMLAVYQDNQKAVEKKAAAAGATCAKGCASCCNLLIGVTFPEAVAVAEKVLTDPALGLKLKALPAQLHTRIQVIDQAAREKNPTMYRDAKLPCVFLDTRDNSCMVYDVRPTSCRLHYSVEDPAKCATPESPKLVDFHAEAIDQLNEALLVSRQTNAPLWSGPFPVMLLWALKLLTQGRQSIEEAHQGPMAEKLGITSLFLWRLKTPAEEKAEKIAESAPDGK